jgi:hypothetical protein
MQKSNLLLYRNLKGPISDLGITLLRSCFMHNTRTSDQGPNRTGSLERVNQVEKGSNVVGGARNRCAEISEQRPEAPENVSEPPLSLARNIFYPLLPWHTRMPSSYFGSPFSRGLKLSST